MAIDQQRGLAHEKVALVTGAGTGIGRATAVLFASEGATAVTVADINLGAAEETAEMVAAHGCEALAVRTDVSSVTEVDAMVESTIERFGRLDCAVNNAGARGPMGTVVDVTDEQWHAMVAVNLNSVFFCMRAEVRAMLERDAGGAIVNISSGSTLNPVPTLFPYVATKFGVIGLTVTGAGQFPDRGIRVNAVLPGSTDTPMLNAAKAEDTTGHVGSARNSRMGRPEELAEMIVWLCSERASYVNGQAMSVDGGSHAYRGGRTVR